MDRYIITVHDHTGTLIERLGPVSFMSAAWQAMLTHAEIPCLPEHEPATRSDVLEVWVIGDRQYRIAKAPQVLVANVQPIRAFG